VLIKVYPAQLKYFRIRIVRKSCPETEQMFVANFKANFFQEKKNPIKDYKMNLLKNPKASR